MTSQVKVPEMGESVVEATVARWMKQAGDAVKAGEALVELETDKVNLEVAAEADGVLAQITHPAGDDVKIGDVLAIIENGASAPSTPVQPIEVAATPVAKRLAEERGVDLGAVSPDSPGGRVTKQDVENYLREQKAEGQKAEDRGQKTDNQADRQTAEVKGPETQAQATSPVSQFALRTSQADPRGETRTRMSRRRRTIAERLVQAQQTAAMLTTFNEIDMSAVLDLRKRRNEAYEKRHGIKLGFMSFFTKAVIGALKAFPQVNAELQESDIVLKHYYDIGIAVGAEEGLVVPILRNADRMSFAEIEKAIKDLATRARAGTLAIDDLRGGTFTITNGGIFGSLLSTPILNPPQVGILGLHKIEERPIALNGQVVIRPLMYVALSYDHRLIDGREAVQFLVKVKELIEDPEALLLEG